MQKYRKTHVCGNRGKPASEKRTFASCHLVLPRLYKSEKKFKKNMRTTIIDVKFDKESKSKLRIGLRKRKPENAENRRKIIKLLVEKNDVEKYLVHQ